MILSNKLSEIDSEMHSRKLCGLIIGMHSGIDPPISPLLYLTANDICPAKVRHSRIDSQ